jgi:hypothetical protein
MVESDPRTVYAVDTHDAMAKVDGRFPHWVAPCLLRTIHASLAPSELSCFNLPLFHLDLFWID